MTPRHWLIARAVSRSSAGPATPDAAQPVYFELDGFWRMGTQVLVKSSAADGFKNATKKEDIETGEDMKAV